MMRKSHNIADRMRLLDASGIRKVFDLAAKMKDPINLSIGQPDFDTPAEVKDAAIAAIRSGQNKYTRTQGTAELRGAVASACQAEFGWDDNRPYLITSGVSGALVLAMQVLVNPGDEVFEFGIRGPRSSRNVLAWIEQIHLFLTHSGTSES